MTDRRVEIGELWRQVSRELHDRFRVAFRGFDLPPMAMIVLRIIHEEEGISISELARRCSTAKSHVSKMIDQLVSQGYIEKRSDPADQRLLRVYTAGSARALQAEMESKARAVWFEIMEQVPEAEYPVLDHALRTLLTAVERSGVKTPKD